MDKLNIESKFMTGIVSKLISHMVSKKLGYEVKIKLNALNSVVTDDEAHVHLDIDADLKKEELMKLLKGIA